MSCRNSATNGSCEKCEECTAARIKEYDWNVDNDAASLQLEASRAWRQTGMEWKEGDGRSRFCDFLDHIAAFLDAAGKIKDAGGPPLDKLIERLTQATWDMHAPTPLAEPAQIAEATRILDNEIVPTVNGIASTVGQVAAKPLKTAAMKVAAHRRDILNDHKEISSEFQQYRARVTAAHMQSAASAALPKFGRPNSAARARRAQQRASATAPLSGQKEGGASTGAIPKVRRHGRGSDGHDVGRYREDMSGSGYQADHRSRFSAAERISALVTGRGRYEFGSFNDSPFEGTPLSYPRLNLGLDTRYGQDMFSAPSDHLRAHTFSNMNSTRDDSRNVYVESRSGRANHASLATRR
ncbi:hypothetical protein [Robbsia andropogonis]|uniref:hypothetical protein n=2 Tax=Robbsia andropogonis TaxID=28092 RepID=UPI00209D72D3|nr:hypothetical protein [Robbsia andropogonis]